MNKLEGEAVLITMRNEHSVEATRFGWPPLTRAILKSRRI